MRAPKDFHEVKTREKTASRSAHSKANKRSARMADLAGGTARKMTGTGGVAGASPEDQGAMFVSKFFEKGKGVVVVEKVADSFGMSKGQLAETIGVRAATLQRLKRVDAPKTQARVREMLEIVARVAGWAGGSHQAMAWYRAEPIPAFGHRTAESLVKEGKAAAVRDYLDYVALGGFA
jgi:uncharacterized protein (DUF2384 family)